MSIRIRIVFFVFASTAFLIIGRLFFIQVMQAGYYAERAAQQHNILEPVKSERGSIFFTSLNEGEKIFVPVAITKKSWNVWISPNKITEGKEAEVSAALSLALDIDESVILERALKKNDPYEPIKEGVSEEEINKIISADLIGVGWEEERSRYYPLGDLASHAIGFVSRQSNSPKGQYGIEEFYDDALSGGALKTSGFKNPLGFLKRSLSDFKKPEEGADVYLTLDYNIQLVAEREIKKAKEELRADSVSVVVLDPKTGSVLAMASYPSFDPNSYNEVENVSRFVNPITQKLFEPGSIFKPITMATGLDINVISPDLTYYDHGFVQVADARIENSTGESYGNQTMTQVLEKSLNTGAVFAVQKIPKGVWSEYIKKFGIGDKTEIDMTGEVRGNIKNIESGGEVERATSSFGQGVAVTPIAFTSAIGVIANNGELVSPHLVDKISASTQDLFKASESKKDTHGVVRPDVAEAVTRMMVSVVENGSGRRAQIRGYSIAGKTGTAQVPSPSGGYSDEVIHSFIGFAPAFNPAFVALVKIDNPKSGSQFSEATAAPLWRNIAEFILRYYEIEPDKPII